MKYSRGSYQILYFGEVGNKLHKDTSTGFILARETVDAYLQENPTHSAVINRTEWNSKDCDNKWDYKNDKR